MFFSYNAFKTIIGLCAAAATQVLEGSSISGGPSLTLTSSLASATPESCPCYTATKVNPCPIPSGCAVPACASITTVTVPTLRPECPTTVTAEVFPNCIPTYCPTGCQVFTQTVTASETCVGGTTAPPSIPTPPLSGCFTYTSQPMRSVCPELTDCVTLACLQIQTSTLPPEDPDCPVTPVVLATPSCIPTCPGGCATSWTTVKATPT